LKEWTLTIVETTKDFIFDGFTTAEWDSPYIFKPIFKRDSHAFLFSVNNGSKYPILGGNRVAIECHSDYCACFGTGGNELVIRGDANKDDRSWCNANKPSFYLQEAKGE